MTFQDGISERKRIAWCLERINAAEDALASARGTLADVLAEKFRDPEPQPPPSDRVQPAEEPGPATPSGDGDAASGRISSASPETMKESKEPSASAKPPPSRDIAPVDQVVVDAFVEGQNNNSTKDYPVTSFDTGTFDTSQDFRQDAVRTPPKVEKAVTIDLASTHNMQARPAGSTFWVKHVCGGRYPLPVFHPEHTKILIWQLVGFMFIIWMAFVLPAQMAFGIESPTLFAIESIMDVYCILDLPLNFVTAYRDYTTSDHKLVTAPDRIAKQYAKTWMAPDLISAVPWDWITVHGTTTQVTKGVRFLKIMKTLRLARLVRLMRMERIKDKVEMAIEAFPAIVFLFGMVEIVCLLLCIVHWSACIWYVIGCTDDYNKTWLKAHALEDDDSWATLYVYSFYFTLTTMTTVGYGDITPQNYYEVKFTLILLILASVVFALLMGHLADLISNLNSDQRQVQEKRRALSQYMRWRKVPPSLFLSIRKHLLNMWENVEQYTNFEDDIKTRLSPVLKKELCFHIYGSLLKKAPFLGWLWNYEACLKELANMVKSETLSAGDLLFRCGDANTLVIMLISGQVHLSMNDSLWKDVKADSADEEEIPLGGALSRALIDAKDKDLEANTKKKKPATADPTQILRNATSQLRKEQARMSWAARFIQKRWRNRQLALKRKPSAPRPPAPNLMSAMRSRAVKAPAYFGESCLWQPYEEWAKTSPCYTYSARCETAAETILIERRCVAEIIERFSPWLVQDFEFFRKAVVAGYDPFAPPVRGADGEPGLPEGQSQSMTQLVLTIKSARCLRNADHLPGMGVSDPYVICTTPSRPDLVIRTKTINDELNPEWNHTCTIDGYVMGDPLVLKIFDDDWVRSDLLGEVSLESSRFCPNGFDGELELSVPKGCMKAYMRVSIEVHNERSETHKGLLEEYKSANKIHEQVAIDYDEEIPLSGTHCKVLLRSAAYLPQCSLAAMGHVPRASADAQSLPAWNMNMGPLGGKPELSLLAAHKDHPWNRPVDATSLAAAHTNDQTPVGAGTLARRYSQRQLDQPSSLPANLALLEPLLSQV